MPECCYDYQGVDHRSFKSEFFSAHSWNDNLGDTLPYLNAVLKLYSEYKARSNLLHETYNTEPLDRLLNQIMYLSIWKHT